MEHFGYPKNLTEQMAMHEVKSNPMKNALDLSQIKNNPVIMNDQRWPTNKGWVKMQRVINSSNGEKITIYFVYNKMTGQFDDFKFIN